MFSEKTAIPFEEQETVVNVDYIENVAHVYSCHKPTINRLQKLADSNPDEVSVEFDNRYGMQIAVPVKWITIKPPRKYSEEERKKRGERLAEAARAKKERELCQ